MKKYLFSIIYGVLLLAFTAYVLLYIYVLPQDGTQAVIPPTPQLNGGFSQLLPDEDSSVFVSEDSISAESSATAEYSSKPDTTENTYADENVNITLSTYRVGDTTVYVADVKLSHPSLLKTALAGDRYGRNIKEKTSVMAEAKGAILAVNGDYYSAREGCVLRNGTLYRDFNSDSDGEALVIYQDGTVDIVKESEGDANALLSEGAMQILSFGPALVKDGEVSVGVNDEVDKAMANNPRTAFVYYSANHYALVVGDGRTSESKGLSLYELAGFLQGLGAVSAYNLDGGGSSTMYFNGRVVNNPTTNGKRISEREVSDIVYVGYEY